MSLQQAHRALDEGAIPDRALVVTADDGYADNLAHAVPLLEQHDVPATVFVTSGYVNSGREFWWDELDRLLLHPGTLPASLQLSIDGGPWSWELGEAATYDRSDYRRDCGWSLEEKIDPGPRQRLFRALFYRLRPLTDARRQKALDDLRAWAEPPSRARESYLPVDTNELANLADHELVEVGAHTVTHPVLSELPLDAQCDEVRGSKRALESALGKPVQSFAYPFGARSDYTSGTVRVVEEAGFARACSNFRDVIWRGTHPFQLPRFVVRDWDGDELAARLDSWFRD
jgi:peptidoglycan/xylan/chitin deacetylase (PgdA/CDA1 family)